MSDWEIVREPESDWEIVRDSQEKNFDPFKFNLLQKHGINYENPFTKFVKEGEKLNQEPNGKSRWKGVAADVANLARGTPKDIWNKIKPQEILGFGNQILNDKTRLLQTGVGGIGNFGRSVAAAPIEARNYLEQKGIIEPDTLEWLKKLKAPDEGVNYAETLGRRGSKWGDEFTKALSLLPLLSGSKGQAGQIKPSQALTGPGPIPNLAKLAKEGTQKVGKAVDIDITPSGIIARRFGGHLPIEQIQRNAAAVEGTKTGLGRILGSPSLNAGLENISTEIPFGGGKNLLSETGEQISSKARGLMPAEYYNSEMLNKVALEAKNSQNKIKNELFQPVNNIAKQEGFTLQLPNSTRIAIQNIKAIQDSPLYANNSKFRQSINKLFGLTKVSEEVPEQTSRLLGPNGKPIVTKEKSKKSSSIVDARVIADDLYETGQRMVKNPTAIDQQQGKLYINLANSMRKEIGQEISKRGSESLQKADALAMANYKKNYVPFLDKEVHKLLSGEELSETFLLDIIRPSKTHDKANRIEKINNLLPENEKHRLGEAYLARSFDKEGHLDPRNLRNVYTKLGNNQAEALYSPELKKGLDDIVKLIDLNPEAVNRMFNPKTGARVSPATFASGMLSTGIGGFDPISLGLSFGTQAGAARYFNYLMTNPKVRQKVIKKIEKNRTKK